MRPAAFSTVYGSAARARPHSSVARSPSKSMLRLWLPYLPYMRNPSGVVDAFPGAEPISCDTAADILVAAVPVRVATLQRSVFGTTGMAARGLAQLVSPELILPACVVVTEYSIPF